MEVKYIEVNFREDDPFIIVKKTNTKRLRSSRVEVGQQKSKPIKKERGLKGGEGSDRRIKGVQEREEKKIVSLF